jgi:hypothetical protein
MIPENLVRRLTQIPGARTIWHNFPVGTVERRVRFGIWPRLHYAFGVYAAADEAKRLGLKAISVFELGVAGGRGLLALESIAAEIGAAMGIEISVFGFDSGEGMPSPAGYRDIPYIRDQGFYKMDADALRSRLKSARLILGSVAQTIPYRRSYVMVNSHQSASSYSILTITVRPSARSPSLKDHLILACHARRAITSGLANYVPYASSIWSTRVRS